MATLNPSPVESATDEVPDLVDDESSDEEDDESSVTTEDIYTTLTPKNLPAVQIYARLNLPAWFVVVVTYTFGLAIGVFRDRC
jgi:hypothetical protein